MPLNTDYSKIFNKIYGSSIAQHGHASIFPKNIFAIIAGSTGCGKTNLMLDLLLNDLLKYHKIMVYTTTPYQPAYQFLKGCDIEQCIVSFHDPNDGIVDPSKLDRGQTHIVIFDDVMNENQKAMTDYFCRGRHNNVNAFYLCQSIHQLKKHGIRQNANIFILFHQDKKTLKYFHETHVSADMPLEEFEKVTDKAWSKKYGYIVINLWEEPQYRYLLNYETMYIPQKYCHKMS